MTMPHRIWLAEPDGALADTDRLSLLKLCSAIAPGEATGDHDIILLDAESLSSPGLFDEVTSKPGLFDEVMTAPGLFDEAVVDAK